MYLQKFISQLFAVSFLALILLLVNQYELLQG